MVERRAVNVCRHLRKSFGRVLCLLMVGAVVSACVHPDTIRVLQSYGQSRGIDVVVVASDNGTTDENALAQAMDDTTAAVMLQSPNFFGCVERIDRMIAARNAGE